LPRRSDDTYVVSPESVEYFGTRRPRESERTKASNAIALIGGATRAVVVSGWPAAPIVAAAMNSRPVMGMRVREPRSGADCSNV
jgi:hypothetical protein